MMKKLIFPALISCSLLSAVQTFGQPYTNDTNSLVNRNDTSNLAMTIANDHAEFIAYAENNMVIMRWGTGQDKEVDHYIVEHSIDSVHFDMLHQIESKEVVDMDSVYQDAESNPDQPINFYRLVTVDSDGISQYSPVIRVDVNAGKAPVLVPSVITMGSTLRLDPYTSGLYQVVFYSPGGQILQSFSSVGSSPFSINTTGWPTGTYYYKISSENRPLVSSGKILLD
jgi:hypothetical protein